MTSTQAAQTGDQLEDISAFKHDQKNARKRTEQSKQLIAHSISRFGAARSIVVDEDNRILAGNGTIDGAKTNGIEKVRVIEADGDEVIAVRRRGLSEEDKVGLALADNRTSDLSEWDKEMLQQLADEHDISAWFSEEDLEELLDEMDEEAGAGGADDADPRKLADRFGLVPFTVLNARDGWWQERKRQWLALGIQSEVGREGNLLGMSETVLEPDEKKRKLLEMMREHGTMVASIHLLPGYYEKKNAGMTDEQICTEFLESGSKQAGTSIFDPVLAELAYRWFCPTGGIVLDPFAGGSVRGIVACKTDRKYVGCELRAEQVEANKDQAATICEGNDLQPVWHNSDSRKIDKVCADLEADMIFSCPPYADLEVYSDDPDDLSTLPYEQFRDSYFEIIKKSCSRLKKNSFACFVVGDVRDKKGNYYNFVGDTVQAFQAAGLHYYNEAILVTPVGTLPIRAGRTFGATRKLGKTHQNVLVFVKGDGKQAAKNCGECDFGDVDATDDGAETDNVEAA